MAKFVDMKPDRFNIALAPGGNILPAMNAWKAFAGHRRRHLLLLGLPQERAERLAEDRIQEAAQRVPPDFFVAGGFAAPSRWSTA
jgi:branched-chain amino acid transport system substrate-binding protein